MDATTGHHGGIGGMSKHEVGKNDAILGAEADAAPFGFRTSKQAIEEGKIQGGNATLFGFNKSNRGAEEDKVLGVDYALFGS